MTRWQPDARGRILRAALELFTEGGYEATSVAQIAAEAGLTKTTLFRYFNDKRGTIFQEQEALVAAVIEGVERAPLDASPMELLREGIQSLCRADGMGSREMASMIDLLVARSPELQERAIFNRSVIISALRGALCARLNDPRHAGFLADLGLRAYREGCSAWSHSIGSLTLAEAVASELEAYETVVRVAGSDRTEVLTQTENKI
jgi:AcrR family transcriptional regulator